MKYRLLWPAVGTLLIAAAGVALLVRSRPLTVEWATATDSEIVGSIIVAGHVAQSGITHVYASKHGTICSVYVVEGELVAAGDTLVCLDDEDERARRARCAVDVTIATLRLEEQSSKVIILAREKVAKSAALESFAVKQCMRSDSLFLQGSITKSELDEIKLELAVNQSDRVTAEAELAAASSTGMGLLQAELAQTNLALKEAERGLARSVVVAPSEGRVEYIEVFKGCRVIPGRSLLDIAADEPSVTVMVKVDERSLSRLRSGLKARITIGPDIVKNAVVKSVASRVDTATGRAIVRLSMEKIQPSLPTGRQLIARITVDGISGTILLDRRFRFDTEQSGHVFVKSGSRVFRRQVYSTDIADNAICIYRGLAPGDTIVYAPGLTEASLVRLARKPAGNVQFPGL